MNFSFQNVVDRLRTFYQSMPVSQRIAYGTVVILAVTLGGLVWRSNNHVEMRTLYQDITPEDVLAIAKKLDGKGIKYETVNGGTAILVPSDKVNVLRLELSADELPSSGGKGVDSFANSPLGATQAAQHLAQTKALEASLARTIALIEPVVKARVHIANPEPTVFVRDKRPTTASVVLTLKSGRSLESGNALAIVNTIARSVPGLHRENITLVDNKGRTLFESGGDEARVGGLHEHQRKIEKVLASKAEDLLSGPLGPGRAVVRVTASISNKSVKKKIEDYDLEKKFVAREFIQSEKTTQPGTKGGAAGTSTNIGPAGKNASTSPASGATSASESAESLTVAPKIIVEYEDPSGAIERLTIAAFVDLSQSGSDGKGLSLKGVEEIIKKAVGFKDGRDEIQVTEARLPGIETAEPSTDAEQLQVWERYLSLVRNGSIAFAAVVALVLGVLVMRRLGQVAKTAAEVAQRAAEDERILVRLNENIERDPKQLSEILSRWLDQANTTSKAA